MTANLLTFPALKAPPMTAVEQGTAEIESARFATQDQFVLVGSSQAVASPGAASPPSGGEGEAAAAKSEASGVTFELPADPMMIDNNPIMVDTAPTFGASTAPSKNEDVEKAKPSHEPLPSSGEGSSAAVAEGNAIAAAVSMVPTERCAVEASLEIKKTETTEGENKAADINCLTLVDATPMQQNNAGDIIPMTANGGLPATDAILTERLGQRREQLDQIAVEIDSRASLLEAAEQRLQERTAALAAMETNLQALLAEKNANDEAQFLRMVSLYETMKPKEAAAILEGLDNDVLKLVARAISSRKMAAIMAKMSPERARELTVALAAPDVELPVVDQTALPLSRVIGQ